MLRSWLACFFCKLHNSIQERRHHAIPHITYFSLLFVSAKEALQPNSKQAQVAWIEANLWKKKKTCYYCLLLTASTIKCMMQLSPNGANCFMQSLAFAQARYSCCGCIWLHAWLAGWLQCCIWGHLDWVRVGLCGGTARHGGRQFWFLRWVARFDWWGCCRCF